MSEEILKKRRQIIEKEKLHIQDELSKEEFENLSKSQLDTQVKQHTRFGSWSEMLQTATKEYVVNFIGF